jgi:carbonic anhydrase
MCIVDSREKMSPHYSKRFHQVALMRTPNTLFITSADYRVVPDPLTSTLPGGLFMIRNVGNLIPPATA